jgi:nitronate monooxygenase
VIRTPLCELLGIEHPILNAPMGGGDAPGALAAAVAEGGALGMIGGTTAGGVDWLRREIGAARAGTRRPFPTTEEGGDPACWAHLVDEDGGIG